jgi:hypothetical protein
MSVVTGVADVDAALSTSHPWLIAGPDIHLDVAAAMPPSRFVMYALPTPPGQRQFFFAHIFGSSVSLA